VGDLLVDESAVESFVSRTATAAGVVGAECAATGPVLGSWRVQDALGDVSVVLTVVDLACAESAGRIVADAGATVDAWRSVDSGLGAV